MPYRLHDTGSGHVAAAHRSASRVARSNKTLQSEAGSIDAKPKTRSTKLLATLSRTIHSIVAHHSLARSKRSYRALASASRVKRSRVALTPVLNDCSRLTHSAGRARDEAWRLRKAIDPMAHQKAGAASTE